MIEHSLENRPLAQKIARTTAPTAWNSYDRDGGKDMANEDIWAMTDSINTAKRVIRLLKKEKIIGKLTL